MIPQSDKDDIKFIGTMHFIWNLILPWILWTIFVVFNLAFKQNISDNLRQTSYNIINFDLSYFTYFLFSILLSIMILGWPLVLFLIIFWIIMLVIWFIKHLDWEPYKYALTINFFKIEKDNETK